MKRGAGEEGCISGGTTREAFVKIMLKNIYVTKARGG